jgi:hypothetical protein
MVNKGDHPLENLNREDLLILRRYNAIDMAIEARPDVFSREDLINHFIARMGFTEEIIERYGIDVTEDWGIDVHTGAIT